MDKFTYQAKKGEDNSYEITVQVTPERYLETLNTTYERMAKDVAVSGFRAGKAPRNVIESKLGSKLLEETLQSLLPQVAAEIVEEEDYSPVTNLQYNVLKMSDGDGVEFTISFTNYPEIKLADLKKLEVEQISTEVEDKEIQEVVQRMFRSSDTDKSKGNDQPEADKVEVTDEMVKELEIGGVTTVSDLEERIRSQIQGMKNQEADREMVSRMIDVAIKESQFEIPKALLEQEAEGLIEGYMERIKELDVDTDGFLAAQGLTHEKLKEQKTEEAKSKISAEIILNEIARKHEVIPTADDIDAEISAIADPEVRTQYESARGRRHVLAVLVQKNAIEKLRELVKVKKAKKSKPYKQTDKKEETKSKKSKK